MPDEPLDDGASEAIYLDHAATSPMRREVWKAMESALGEADLNASSPHGFGQKARARLEAARRSLAACLGGEKRRLVFTGGGTESDNLAVLGFARARRGKDPRVLVSAVEHEAVRQAAAQAAREGARVETVPVDGSGTVELEALEALLTDGDGAPTLVSLMWANNEVGTVQPLAEAVEIAHRHGALVHTDAVQALGKTEVSVEEVPVDLLTSTAHKLGGSVGIGLLYLREGIELEPLVRGGSQEDGLWPGTQNPLAAVGFAAAAELAVDELPESAEHWRDMREELADRLREDVPDVRVHGRKAPRRLPNLLSVGIPGCDAASLLVSLDMDGVAVSSGSACSSGSSSPSHVLEAMGLEGPSGEVAVLRFSFGPDTTSAMVRRAGDATVRAVERLRAGSRAAGAR
jgi:cysteine desulfurase